MKMKFVVLIVAATFLFACGSEADTNAAHVYAKLYYRFEASTLTYTAEATLSERDSLIQRDTAFTAPGGVAFMNTNLKRDIVKENTIRYKGSLRVSAPAPARYTFKNLQEQTVEIPGTLNPFDSLIMGPMPTHNFGFTVYHSIKQDSLGPNESLTALFQPDDGSPKLGVIQGPTAPNSGFLFPRNTVADWPLSQGTLTFVRKRVSEIAVNGVKGILEEEVYSKPIRSAVVN